MKDLTRVGPLLQLGWVVAFTVLIPLGLGLWLDRRFGTAPLFVLVGALLGILASTVAAVRLASRTIEALSHPPTEKSRPDEPVDRASPAPNQED
ncbi:MAG: putative F0F1-ATPase [Chloroflexi bacterium ADurb.Bin325]|nr:MAG: putative F0F1-ATPase [Chloroflexi bacterium ADurb.Bin325]